MRKSTLILGSLCATFLLGGAATNARETASAATLTQGANNRYYLYGDAASAYYQMVWDKGDMRFEYDATEAYASIDENSAHPGGAGAVIVAWRAPADGEADLTFTAHHESTNGDGVVLKFGKREIQGERAYGDYESVRDDYTLLTARQTFEITDQTVSRGDMFFFSIDKGATDANDSTGYALNVSFTQTAEGTDYGDYIGDKRRLKITDYYSDEQGKNGWYYAFGEVDKYVLMTWGNCNDGSRTWRGNYAYQQIGADYMHPAGRWKTLRVWIADSDGTVAIEGGVRKQTPYGDGVRVGFYKNGEALWNVEIEGSDDKRKEITGLENISVKKGDAIVVTLDAGAKINENSDGTSFLFELYYVERTGEALTGDLSSYLCAVKNEAGIVGAVHVEPSVENDDKKVSSSCSSSCFTLPVLFSMLGAAVAVKRRKEI